MKWRRNQYNWLQMMNNAKTFSVFKKTNKYETEIELADGIELAVGKGKQQKKLIAS